MNSAMPLLNADIEKKEREKKEKNFNLVLS